MNNYEEWKKYLGDIWIDISKITHHISDSLFSALYNESINPDEIKCFAAPQTPPEAVLECLWLNVGYFEWKRILDLWWGFGGMPFLLEKYVNQYIVCDPCLLDEVRLSAFDRALTTQEFVTLFNQWILDDRIKEFNKLESNNLVWTNRYNELIKLKTFSANFLEKKKKVLDYIKMRKNFNQEEHPKIIINSSKWEDIQWIENNSQDIVFICHILDKDYVNYNWILAEASRILKPDWEILIVEDADNKMIKILKKLWLKRQEISNKLICRIKKT